MTGQEYWQGSVEQDLFPLEANRQVTVTECWMRVDRDGDGIAELKHFIVCGSIVLWEQDVDMIPLAAIVPIDIPYEFYGLSMADMTRSSTLASTAILRGFVENTYLTNYSPKLADPNVVDFSALQNMKPKQIIATNGNPATAVQAMPPDTLASGTIPLLEFLQTHKEQGTGMSKAAQGLNEDLYVSGNSEVKLQAVMSASQKRIQHIARRFAETGIKRLCIGVYKTMKMNMKKISYSDGSGLYSTIDANTLPNNMDLEIMLDIGENSNSSRLQKLQVVGQQIVPALAEAGASGVLKPEVPALLASKTLEALGFNPADYLVDYTTDEFKAAAEQMQQEQAAKQQEADMLDMQRTAADIGLAEANVRFTHVQSDNAVQDNVRQTAVAIDKHWQEWADLVVKATKEGAELPPKPEIGDIFVQANEAVTAIGQMNRQQNQPQNQQVTEEQTPPVV